MTWVDHESGGHVGGRKVLAAPELPPGGLVRTAAAKVPAAERVVTARRHLIQTPVKDTSGAMCWFNWAKPAAC